MCKSPKAPTVSQAVVAPPPPPSEAPRPMALPDGAGGAAATRLAGRNSLRIRPDGTARSAPMVPQSPASPAQSAPGGRMVIQPAGVIGAALRSVVASSQAVA